MHSYFYNAAGMTCSSLVHVRCIICKHKAGHPAHQEQGVLLLLTKRMPLPPLSQWACIYLFHTAICTTSLYPFHTLPQVLAFSRERVSTATFAVRGRSSAALAASVRRFLPAFPDVRHVVLR